MDIRIKEKEWEKYLLLISSMWVTPAWGIMVRSKLKKIIRKNGELQKLKDVLCNNRILY